MKAIAYNIDSFKSRPYWIIDILPKQVPAGSAGQYFTIEKYLLSPPRVSDIYRKFARVLIALNCYHDIIVQDGSRLLENPSPAALERLVLERKWLNVLVGSDQAMIAVTGDDHYMTLYGPSKDLLELIRNLAAGQGFYVWKPKNIKTKQ